MKISRKEAQALGLIVPPVKRQKTREDPRQRQALLTALCKAHGVPEPIYEYEFARSIGRNWRWDMCWEGWLALECQGGIFIGGRHVQGAALLKEQEKINNGVLLGWSCMFCTPADLNSGAIFPLIKKALQGDCP
jgi:hypothetical protein